MLIKKIGWQRTGGGERGEGDRERNRARINANARPCREARASSSWDFRPNDISHLYCRHFRSPIRYLRSTVSTVNTPNDLSSLDLDCWLRNASGIRCEHAVNHRGRKRREKDERRRKELSCARVWSSPMELVAIGLAKLPSRLVTLPLRVTI